MDEDELMRYFLVDEAILAMKCSRCGAPLNENYVYAGEEITTLKGLLEEARENYCLIGADYMDEDELARYAVWERAVDAVLVGPPTPTPEP